MNKFKQEVQTLIGLKLSDKQLQALKWYEKELVTWNKQINLTAISEPKAIRTKHFLDSVSCALVLKGEKHTKLIDVGTGAGFPGIPLRILFPHIQLTLVESIGKKAEFCKHVVKSLGLDQTVVIQNRAEGLGQNPSHRENYDCATARAVANMSILVEYLLPLVRIGGIMVALKGESGPIEAQSAETAITLLGGHLKQIHEIQIPGIAEERYLIVIEKIAATPNKYPRRIGVPLKHPIS